jgi:hypothetical protein
MRVPLVWKLARLIVLLAFAVAASSSGATGQTPAMPADAPPELAAIDAQLHRGEWEPARAAALARIEAELANPAAPGLARSVARLALAEAGLGRQEDALWHWGAAQNLDHAALSPAELAAFGAAGELLARHPLRRLDETPAGLTVYRQDDLKVQPARRIAGEIPQLPKPPKGAEGGVLRIQGIVDLEGRFREPTVVGEGSPASIYRVLEALREWRYAPARRDLRQVASFRSVLVGAPGEGPVPAPPLRLGQYPPPGPGRAPVIQERIKGPEARFYPKPPPL